MERLAIADYPVHDLIARRWSPSVRPILLSSPTRSARSSKRRAGALSSFNEQPWRYILATTSDGDHYARVLSCLMEKNQAWAKGAPVLILTFASSHVQPQQQAESRCPLRRRRRAPYSPRSKPPDLGLFVHQMAGIDVQRIRETFHVPEEFEPATAIALGYPPDAKSITSEQMEKLAVARSEHRCVSWSLTAPGIKPIPLSRVDGRNCSRHRSPNQYNSRHWNKSFAVPSTSNPSG